MAEKAFTQALTALRAAPSYWTGLIEPTSLRNRAILLWHCVLRRSYTSTAHAFQLSRHNVAVICYHGLWRINKKLTTTLDPFERLSLSVRTYNALKGAGVSTLKAFVALREVPDQELLRSRNLGKVTLQEIRTVLRRMEDIRH